MANESLDLTKRPKKSIKHQSVRKLISAIHESQMAEEENLNKLQRSDEILAEDTPSDNVNTDLNKIGNASAHKLTMVGLKNHSVKVKMPESGALTKRKRTSHQGGSTESLS